MKHGYGYAGSFTTEWYNNNTNNRSTIGWHLALEGRDHASTPAARPPYGTVRSYVDVGVSSNVTGASDGSLGAQGYINRWFIQWAGFTIGHSTSFFDFYSIGANQYGFVSAGSDTGDGGWTVFAYTANFGNGFSASISAEVQRDTSDHQRGSATGHRVLYGRARSWRFHQSSRPRSALATRRSRCRIWSPICASTRPGARLRSWARCTRLPRPTTAPREGTGHPSDKLGFAVGAGIKLKADVISQGRLLRGRSRLHPRCVALSEQHRPCVELCQIRRQYDRLRLQCRRRLRRRLAASATTCS